MPVVISFNIQNVCNFPTEYIARGPILIFYKNGVCQGIYLAAVEDELLKIWHLLKYL